MTFGSSWPKWGPPLLFLVAALVIRAQTFGQPLLHMDENFYLLVGDRLAHQGAWPYVDIWDRKPVGLFVLYALFAALPGDPFWNYQIAATLFAAATAWLVYAIAAMVVARRYALVGGVIYLAYLTFFGGYGGQSPVYYNLLVAGGAYLVIRALCADEKAGDGAGRMFWSISAAMLLFGLAMQIKYSVVFEGMFFGLVALWANRRAPVFQFISSAAVWVALALLPTAFAFSVYQWSGYGDAFVYANFISIFERGSGFDGMAAKRLASLAGLFSILLILTIPALFLKTNIAGRVVKGWAMAAVASLLIFGTYYNHYGLPLVLPLSVLATFSLSWLGARWRVMQRGGLIAVALIFVAAGAIGTHVKLDRKGSEAEVARLLAH